MCSGAFRRAASRAAQRTARRPHSLPSTPTTTARAAAAGSAVSGRAIGVDLVTTYLQEQVVASPTQRPRRGSRTEDPRATDHVHRGAEVGSAGSDGRWPSDHRSSSTFRSARRLPVPRPGPLVRSLLAVGAGTGGALV